MHTYLLTLMLPQELSHDMTYVDAVTEPHKHEMEFLSISMGKTFLRPLLLAPMALETDQEVLRISPRGGEIDRASLRSKFSQWSI